MQGNKSRVTTPELAVRRLVHARGLRYRVRIRPVPTLRRTADLIFTRARVAVFVDGCFWHGCAEHFVSPKLNARYWGPKIQANITRDTETTFLLEKVGWTVLRFWAHSSAAEVADRIEVVVLEARR
ncbi:very short patch repair endonuclease [Cryobacterium sp. MDB2-A-2]|nr:very short patch repair endonuclease [Cryobacterium sp. MDB2-A-1]TFC12039.1 very short patch repair endonuclease [Cryobacterium sp. MDB2-A-2]